jgi:hypothetical protein
VDSKELISEVKTALSSMTKPLGDNEFYLYGSVGRRIEMTRRLLGEGVSVEEYLKKTRLTILAPRTNERDKVDLDVAVFETAISWPEIAKLANLTTQKLGGVEIDPHLIKAGSNEGSACVTSTFGRRVEFQLNPEEVPFGETGRVLTPSLESMMAYYFAMGKIRKKDIREMTLCLGVIKITDKEWTRKAAETWWPLAVAYIRSGEWLMNLAKGGYRAVTTESMREKIRPLIGRTEKALNFLSEKPVYM